MSAARNPAAQTGSGPARPGPALQPIRVLPIPQPPPTPAHERASLWRDVTAGFRFVWRNRPLLMVFVFTAATNFFYAGAIALNTPYILSRTDSQTTLGALQRGEAVHVEADVIAKHVKKLLEGRTAV